MRRTGGGIGSSVVAAAPEGSYLRGNERRGSAGFPPQGGALLINKGNHRLPRSGHPVDGVPVALPRFKGAGRLSGAGDEEDVPQGILSRRGSADVRKIASTGLTAGLGG
jgi:hypothetical protein